MVVIRGMMKIALVTVMKDSPTYKECEFLMVSIIPVSDLKYVYYGFKCITDYEAICEYSTEPYDTVNLMNQVDPHSPEIPYC